MGAKNTARTLSINPSLTPATIRRARLAFRADHAARLQQTLERLPDTARDVLNALPLLLHANHPSLPGFAGFDTPAGIAGYRADATTLAALRRFSRNYRYVPAATRQPEINALFIMGSAGSVAHTRTSDLDVWVCVEERHVDAITRKLEALTLWAAGLDVELQCFAVPPGQFSHPGAAAYAPLLLDEFYRTGCHLAGQIPLWWVLPSDAETYAEQAHAVLRKRMVQPRDYIDFGPVQAFQSAELLAAGVRELEHSRVTPYKSLLKLALLESYAAGSTPLSTRYRKTVVDGARGTSDSYLMLAEQIDEFFQGPRLRSRQQFMRHAWIIKTSRGNTRLTSSDAWWALVSSWGYGREDVEHLRWPGTWSLTEIVSEHQLTMAAYAHAFSFLDTLSRTCPHATGRQQHVERLDQLRQTIINGTQYNDRLLPALVPTVQRGRAVVTVNPEGLWCLEEAGRTFVLRPRLTQVFLWLKRQSLGPGALAPAMRENNRYRQIHAALQHEPFVLVLNAETDSSLSAAARSAADTLIAEKDDPLSYGNDRVCQVTQLELLQTRAEGRPEAHAWTNLAEALPELLRRPATAVVCIGDVRRARIARRVEQLLGEARKRLAKDGNFLFTLGKNICCLHKGADGEIEAQLFPHRYAAFLSCPGARHTVFSEHGRQDHRGWLARDNVMHTPTLIINTQNEPLHIDYRSGSGTKSLHPPPRRQRDFIQSLSLFCAALNQRGIDIPKLRLCHVADNVERLPRPDIHPHLRFRLVFIQTASGWTVQCGQETWSSNKIDGRLLDRVRRTVQEHRRGGADYPIYLTDIDLIEADFIAHLEAKFALETALSGETVSNPKLFRDLA